MTMPSPRRPPPTHTGRPTSRLLSAISQLAKKLSPSTCKIRLLGRLLIRVEDTSLSFSIPLRVTHRPRIREGVGHPLSYPPWKKTALIWVDWLDLPGLSAFAKGEGG